jgi:hypothetical protein
MKKQLLSLSLLSTLLFLSCTEAVNENGDTYEDEYGYSYTLVEQEKVTYKARYFTKDSVIASTKVEEPREMVETGKIYIFGDYIFINEVDKGIHVINNKTPETPVKEAFIAIPGNVDMAIRDSILYADAYGSLVALNISDLQNVKVEKVINDLFNRSANQWDYIDYSMGYEIEYDDNQNSSDIVGYDSVSSEIVEVKEYNYNGDDVDMDPVAGGDAGGESGTGGSMARFTIIDKYLYVLSGADIQLIDIEDPADPAIWSKVSLDWDIETIFPYKDKIFVGSSSGMYILDNSNPSDPVLKGTFGHVRSCDPVVATDSLAYVTLRGGSNCGGNDNQLDILDITDITNPRLIKTYQMNGPYGLAIKDTTLLICDGDAGLKVYNARDSENLIVTDWIKNISTYDVIIDDTRALVIAKDGLYQYDITNINGLILLSFFPVNSEQTEE